MAYDEYLAHRIRRVVGATPGVSEKKMFGGVCFLRYNLMFAGVVGTTLMARIGPAAYAQALSLPDVREMDFTGKPLIGYVYVDEPAMATDPELAQWLQQALAYVSTLPPKPSRAASRAHAPKPT